MKKVWEKLQLGEMVSSVERSEVTETGVKYRQIGVRLWGGGAYERGQIDGGDTQYTTFNRCESGDLVLNKIWARNGSITIVPPDLSGCYVSPEFPLFRLKTLVIPGWLRIVTKSRWFWEECNDQAYGTSGKNRIKTSAFLNIKIPLPPITEQQRIVAHLDAIETHLNRVKKLREQQEQELHALLCSAFHKLEEKADWVEMAEVAPVIRRPVDIDPESSYPELGIRSFGRGTFHKPKILGIETTKRIFQIHEGDLLFSNVFAWEGAVAVAKSEDQGRVGSHRFISCMCDKQRLLPEYIQFYFLTSGGLEKLNNASPGGAGRNRTLGISKLEKIKIPVVSLEMQKQFNKLLKIKEKIQTEAAVAFQQTTALMPSFLDRIFS